LVLALLVSLVVPALGLAQPTQSLEITGDGVTTPLELTRAQLEAMPQYQHVYSTINTWPTKKWYTARGVKLRDLLAMAGVKEEAKLVRFVSSDGYQVTLTVKQLLKDKRYYFPGLQENHPTDGSVPGSPLGAVEVEPILALVSAEGSTEPNDMNDRDSLMLVIGQRAVTEQTNPLFLKYVSKIEVLTAQPEKWDSPKANIPSGTVVPKGTLVRLSNKGNNDDKIHYTTDGTTPTVESPMYNWCASRWWPLRDDLDSVNRPIRIERDTVIKAITIGPGKEDSDVVTFVFKVDQSGKAVDPTKVSGGPPTGVTLDRSVLNLRVGSTFQLAAAVEPFNADDQRIIWSSSDTSVATVDMRGLVTVVGPGTATITARTAAGGHTAVCIVNGLTEWSQEDRSEDASSTGGEPPGIGAQEEPGNAVGPPAGAGITPEEEEATGASDEPPANEQPGGERPTATPDEPSAEERPAAEPPADEPPVPEGMQYLAEKKEVIKDLAAGSGRPNVSPGQPPGQSWQVFEVSLAADVPPPLRERQHRAAIYAAVLFLSLFLSGATKGYAEYARER